MKLQFKLGIAVLASTFLGTAPLVLAQQKPQWMPGQVGLNAGILPSPGLTYVNMDINYDADAFNGPKGNAVPVTGTYNVWAVEDIFYYVFNGKLLGGNYGMMVIFPTPATGSLVADITNPNLPNLSATAGGSGLGDLFLQPFTLGWHLKRADLQVAEAFVADGPVQPRSVKQCRLGLFRKSPSDWDDFLHHKEQRHQRQLVYRLGSPRTTTRTQQYFQDTRSSVH
jgi:hypothetical protein